MSDETTGEFIAGFVEGEGCFSLNYNGNKKTNHWLRPMFSLGCNPRDKELLEKIRDFIGCGRIYFEKNRNFYS